MMAKRFVISTLAAYMLFLLVSALPGCSGAGSGKSDKPNSGGENDPSADSGNEAAATTGRLQADLPDDLDFGGETFTFLVTGPNYGAGYYETKDIWAEGQNGETLNDAVYMRNRNVEQKLNIDIAEYKSNNVEGDARKTINAGDDLYDAIFATMYDCATMAQNKLTVNIKDMLYIDLDKPWWDKNASNELSVKHKLYFTTGDISTAVKSGVYLVIFNKKLIKEFELGDPYEHVRNNTWNFDAYAQMVRSVYVDANGNGVRDDEDIYGAITNSYDPFFFAIGFGERLTSSDANGIPQITINSDSIYDKVNKIWDLYYDAGATRSVNDMKHSGEFTNVYTYSRSLFASDKFLFNLGMPLIMNEFRDMDSDFGLLPFPKYDEKQSRYYHTIDYTVVSLCIPTTCDPNKTGTVLEAMAAESMYTVSPAYDEILLKRKYFRGDESEFILDIVNGSRTYDLSVVFKWEGLGNIIQSVTAKKSRALASEIEKIYDKAQEGIEKTVKAFED